MLASKTKDAHADTRTELQRQETMIAAQQDRLLNLQINDQLDEASFNRRQAEITSQLFLNFLKPFASDGLSQTTPKIVRSSKSSG